MLNANAILARVRAYFSAREIARRERERERRALVRELRALDELRIYHYRGEERVQSRLAELSLLDAEGAA